MAQNKSQGSAKEEAEVRPVGYLCMFEKDKEHKTKGGYHLVPLSSIPIEVLPDSAAIKSFSMIEKWFIAERQKVGWPIGPDGHPAIKGYYCQPSETCGEQVTGNLPAGSRVAVWFTLRYDGETSSDDDDDDDGSE